MRKLLAMKTIFLLFFSLLCSQLDAQEQLTRNEFRGEFPLGIRFAISFFDNTYTGLPGLGTGGGFKIRLGNRINTDWFAGYIVGAATYIKRTDSHIGWSVVYYPFNYQNKGLKPFISAGHCFDYTRNSDVADFSNFANS